MYDSTAIQSGEALRASWAHAIAEYEAKHGPIQTQPIIRRGKEGKVLPFSISPPGKSKPDKTITKPAHRAVKRDTVAQREHDRKAQSRRNKRVAREVWA